MKDGLSAAVYAKALSMSAECLTADDYSLLTRCTTVREAVKCLNATARYRDLFAEIKDAEIHRGLVEEMLRKDLIERYGRLLTFLRSGKNSIAWSLIRRLEIGVLLNVYLLVSRGSSDRAYTVIPFYIQKHASFDLSKLAEVRDMKSLLDVINGTRYAELFRGFLARYGGDTKAGKSAEGVGDTGGAKVGTGSDPDINLLTSIMFNNYYEWALSASKKDVGENSPLRRLITRWIKLEDLLICYRMKRYFKSSADEITSNLMLGKRFLNSEQLSMLEDKDAQKSAEFFLKELSKDFADENQVLNEDDVDVAVRRQQLRCFRRALHISSDGVTALYSLMRMLEIEQQNVTTIIEGIRYGVAADEFDKMLVW